MTIPSTAAPVDSKPRKRARMLRYSVWQARDFLLDRAIPLIIVEGLLGYLTLAPLLYSPRFSVKTLTPALIAKWGGMQGAVAMLMKDRNEMFLRGFLSPMVFVGALLAMQGLVADDRKKGYYRFLFTKPVPPWRYYGQAIVIHALGFVGIVALLGAVYGAAVWPILTMRLVVVLPLMFLMYAGISFLLSAAARWDWLSLVAVIVAANFFWGRFQNSSSVFARLLYLLPPVHRTDEVYVALATGEPLPWPLIEWYVGYGVVCFVAGLVVLRYRRLAIV